MNLYHKFNFIIFSANSIQTRHQLLLDNNIGVFTEEIEAYEQVCFLRWFIPVFVTLAWIVDCLLILLFHFCFHPWLDILKEDTKGDGERILKEVEAMIDVKMTNEKAKEFLKRILEEANNVMALLQNPHTANVIRCVMNFSDDDKKDVIEAMASENAKVKEGLQKVTRHTTRVTQLPVLARPSFVIKKRDQFGNKVWSKYV